MRKYAVTAAVLAMFAGAVGFTLRNSQLQRALEPDTGLPAAGSVSTLVLISYTFIVLAAVFALALLVRERFYMKETYREAIAPANMFYLIVVGLVYVMLLASGVFRGISAMTGHLDSTELSLGVLTIVAGASIFGLAYEAFRGNDLKASLVYSLLPEIFLTFWLLVYYRQNTTNPVRLEYVYQALAMASSALSFYFTAGYVYGRRAPLRLIMAYGMSVYFCITVLAEDIAFASKVCFGALSIYFFISIVHFVGNLEPKYPKPPQHLKQKWSEAEELKKLLKEPDGSIEEKPDADSMA